MKSMQHAIRDKMLSFADQVKAQVQKEVQIQTEQQVWDKIEQPIWAMWEQIRNATWNAVSCFREIQHEVSTRSIKK